MKISDQRLTHKERTVAKRVISFSAMGHTNLEAETVTGLTRLAENREDFLAAYRLVYAAYRERGYCRFSPNELVYEPTFGTPASRTILAFDQHNHLDGALTIVLDSGGKLKIDSLNLPHIKGLRLCGRKLAEVRCLAVQTGAGGDGLATFFSLTRFLIQYAYWMRLDDLLLAIHPRHLNFYRRSFNARPIGSTQHYCAAGNHPAVGCHINLRTLPDFADPTLFCRYMSEPISAEEFKAPDMSAINHAYFCHLAGLNTNTFDQAPLRRAA